MKLLRFFLVASLVLTIALAAPVAEKSENNKDKGDMSYDAVLPGEESSLNKESAQFSKSTDDDDADDNIFDEDDSDDDDDNDSSSMSSEKPTSVSEHQSDDVKAVADAVKDIFETKQTDDKPSSSDDDESENSASGNKPSVGNKTKVESGSSSGGLFKTVLLGTLMCVLVAGAVAAVVTLRRRKWRLFIEYDVADKHDDDGEAGVVKSNSDNIYQPVEQSAAAREHEDSDDAADVERAPLSETQHQHSKAPEA